MMNLEKLRELRERFDGLPVKPPLIEFLGVVDPSGVSMGRMSGQKLWTLRLEFSAWRLPAGTVKVKSMIVEREIDESDFKQIQDSVKPYDVLRISAFVLIDDQTGDAYAVLDQFMGLVKNDMELNAIVDEQKKPVTVIDSVFGVLSLNKRINKFTSEVDWLGKKVKLFVDGDCLEDAIVVAHEIWKSQASWDTQARYFALRKLLKLKNDSWLDEDGNPVSEEEFMNRMSLAEISAHEDDFEFWFDDGDLFSGHVILLQGKLKEGMMHAEIAG